ncbi:unnamed protein product [Sphagnum compactum]
MSISYPFEEEEVVTWLLLGRTDCINHAFQDELGGMTLHGARFCRAAIAICSNIKSYFERRISRHGGVLTLSIPLAMPPHMPTPVPPPLFLNRPHFSCKRRRSEGASSAFLIPDASHSTAPSEDFSSDTAVSGGDATSRDSTSSGVSSRGSSRAELSVLSPQEVQDSVYFTPVHCAAPPQRGSSRRQRLAAHAGDVEESDSYQQNNFLFVEDSLQFSSPSYEESGRTSAPYYTLDLGLDSAAFSAAPNGVAMLGYFSEQQSDCLNSSAGEDGVEASLFAPICYEGSSREEDIGCDLCSDADSTFEQQCQQLYASYTHY